ncbi:hypothetical protein [Halobaculum sp. MBLA0143]|uniref:hypothetical protein n=1 Tax=Halobaculum sp. MBLA0143 TaxID=3079933 RepID=UPI0035245A16
MGVDRPAVPAALIAGWRETEATVTRPFDARVVTVDAHTVVYDDDDLHDRLAETAGVSGRWRFFVAARLALSPRAGPSRALTRLVADRAHDGFADRLADRGLERVRQRGTRWETVADRDARVASYEAVYDPGPVSVRTSARVAVRPADEGYLLAGGAYPTAVRGSGDPETGEAVAAAVEPERFDDELTTLIGAVE